MCPSGNGTKCHKTWAHDPSTDGGRDHSDRADRSSGTFCNIDFEESPSSCSVCVFGRDTFIGMVSSAVIDVAYWLCFFLAIASGIIIMA